MLTLARFVFGSVIVSALLLLVALIAGSWMAADPQVMLSAAPARTQVQMFDRVVEGPNVQVTTFPNGTHCQKLDDTLYRLGSGHTAIYFHKLDCQGTVGFVNDRWVFAR